MTLLWLTCGVVAVNAGLIVANFAAAVRLRRQLRHAQELDALLACLCLQCFTLHHQPIWRAWTAVMGSITIDISQTRNLPGDQP